VSSRQVREVFEHFYGARPSAFSAKKARPRGQQRGLWPTCWLPIVRSSECSSWRTVGSTDSMRYPRPLSLLAGCVGGGSSSLRWIPPPPERPQQGPVPGCVSCGTAGLSASFAIEFEVGQRNRRGWLHARFCSDLPRARRHWFSSEIYAGSPPQRRPFLCDQRHLPAPANIPLPETATSDDLPPSGFNAETKAKSQTTEVGRLSSEATDKSKNGSRLSR
jgi:hypothetical protein